jgi:cytochrome P450
MQETSDAAPGTPVPLDQAFYQDPHEVYRGLRTEGPVQPITTPDGRPGWLVTSYSDARALLADPRLSKQAREIAKVLPPGMEGAFASPLVENMLFSDPPDHTRLRRLVNKAFTARATQRLRPQIERAADELLDALSSRATFDLVAGYALPLPIIGRCSVPGDR